MPQHDAERVYAVSPPARPLRSGAPGLARLSAESAGSILEDARSKGSPVEVKRAQMQRRRPRATQSKHSTTYVSSSSQHFSTRLGLGAVCPMHCTEDYTV